MRKRVRPLVALFVLTGAAMCHGECEEKTTILAPRIAALSLSNQAQPVEAAFFQVHLDVLDARLTAKESETVNTAGAAADVAATMRAVAADKRMKILFSFDSKIKSDTIFKLEHSDRLPIVSSQSTASGKSQATVQYEDVGCRVSGTTRAPSAPHPGSLELELKIDATGLDSPEADVAQTAIAPTLWNFQHAFTTLATIGSDAYIFSLKQSGAGSKDAAYAKLIVVRMRFDIDKADGRNAATPSKDKP